jgi:pyruvate dehydrogenase E2 component (dihydrolipoamide acetyltransferase)
VADLTEVLVPDIGDYSDVPVIEILVAVGDEIAPEDPLVVLESDKATMEVPSPSAGTVESVAVNEGDTVSAGDLILKLTVSGREESPAGGRDSAEAAPDEPEKAPAEDVEDADEPREPEQPETPVHAGPAARKLARELGVDLSALTGSGRKGRITTDDVRAAGEGERAEGERAAPAAGREPAAPRADLPAWPEVDHASFGPVETVELSRIKRIAGPALSRNWALIPHVTQFDEADITELEAFRKEVNAAHADEGVKLTMVSLLLKACAAALRTFPEFNSSLEGDSLVLKQHYHLGFAVDTPGGLMVPVIRDVDRKGLLEIARELIDLSGAAREGTIGAEQMRGGTFTISSLGGIGGTAFTPIINAPEVAILGVSRSAMKPVYDGAGFRPRLMLPLSLSYDHRVIDGAAAARFTTHLAGLLSDPRQMLL